MINERCSLQNQRRKLLLITPLKGGGGGTPYNGLCGEAPPKRGTFFRLQVYERVGKSVTSVCKKAQKGLQMHFMAVKRSRKSSGFLICSYF